jgi:tetratricopeptide (TPR) repeat protein
VLTAWLIVLLGSAVSAGPLPPDYRVVLDGDFGRSLSALNGAGRYREAIQLGGRIQRAVDRLPHVSYEIGYAHYQLGELDAAIRNYDAALLREPGLTEALYDRGEVHLQVGRYEAASKDFSGVVEQTPNHWAGHFRMAHLAGLSGDSDGFEGHLMTALQHGFNLDVVTSDPEWIGFSRHSVLRPVLRKIIVLYGDESLLKWIGEGP